MDHGDDAGEHGVATDAGGGHGERAVAVDRAGNEGVPVGFGDRQGFARDHGFVDVGRATGDGAVDGDALAGAQLDPVADADLRDGDFGGFAITDHAGGVGLQADQAADGGAGLAAGAGLHPAAQKDEGDDDRGGLVIDGDGAGGRTVGAKSARVE